MKDKFIEWLRSKRVGGTFRVREFLVQYAHLLGIVPMYASLSARHIRNGKVTDLGVVAIHAVTDAFVAQLVDTLQSSEATFSDYKWHDSGTGNTAEAAADTTLDIPTGEARVEGTQIEGATANIYKSVAIYTYNGVYTIVEHGLFNALINGGLADRSVVVGIGVIVNDKIEWTYELICAAGG